MDERPKWKKFTLKNVQIIAERANVPVLPTVLCQFDFELLTLSLHGDFVKVVKFHLSVPTPRSQLQPLRSGSSGQDE